MEKYVVKSVKGEPAPMCQECNTRLTIGHIILNCKGLVINYGEGGATKREGGACEVLSLRKRGGAKSFSHAEGGAQKVLG